MLLVALLCTLAAAAGSEQPSTYKNGKHRWFKCNDEDSETWDALPGTTPCVIDFNKGEKFAVTVDTPFYKEDYIGKGKHLSLHCRREFGRVVCDKKHWGRRCEGGNDSIGNGFHVNFIECDAPKAKEL